MGKERVFHAVVAWNGQHPNDTFAFTNWLLEGTFGVNRKAAREFCQEFHDEDRTASLLRLALSKKERTMAERDTSTLKAFGARLH